jgi:hypothetical protein
MARPFVHAEQLPANHVTVRLNNRDLDNAYSLAIAADLTMPALLRLVLARLVREHRKPDADSGKTK